MKCKGYPPHLLLSKPVSSKNQYNLRTISEQFHLVNNTTVCKTNIAQTASISPPHQNKGHLQYLRKLSFVQ